MYARLNNAAEALSRVLEQSRLVGDAFSKMAVMTLTTDRFEKRVSVWATHLLAESRLC